MQTIPTFVAGTPTRVLEGPYRSGFGNSFDVSPDGQRFLMIQDERPPAAASMVVVLNWLEELKTKTAAAR